MTRAELVDLVARKAFLKLEKMGRPNEAIGFYSQALKIKPNDELATSLLAKVQVN